MSKNEVRRGELSSVDDPPVSFAKAWWSEEIQDALYDCTAAIQMALDQMRKLPGHDPESLDMLVDAVHRMESAIAASEPLDIASTRLLLQFLRYNCKPTIQRLLIASRVHMAYRQSFPHRVAS